MNDSPSKKSTIWDLIGWLALVAFVAIYCVELLPHHGRPVTIAWIESHFGKAGLILANLLIAGCFLLLLPYRRNTRHVWKSRGAFLAFMIALMTEMFGFPLLIFMAAPLIDVPIVARDYFDYLGHWPATLGTAISLVGLLLVGWGWRLIHRSQGMVSHSVYRLIRHPQYTGLMMFTLGWLIHWPSLFTLALWPILLLAYIWLARFEEKLAIDAFGDAYRDYMNHTKRFIPFLV